MPQEAYPRRQAAGQAALFVAGVVAGALVGAVDGLRAGLLARLDIGGLLACGALTAGLDALVGAVAGAALTALAGAARWGRAVAVSRLPRTLGWVAAGMMTGAVAAIAVLGTASRFNRFLAAGVVCLAAVLAGAGGALLGPALARLVPRVARGTGAQPWPRVTPGGLLLVAPLATLALAALAFVPVWHARPWLGASARLQLALLVGAVAALLPLAMFHASHLRLPLSWARAVAVAALLFGVPALAVVLARWRTDFQFVRWNDAAVLVALAVIGVGPVLRWVHSRRRAVRWALGGCVAALVLVLVAGASEPARKAASARAGLALPLLAEARLALDFDHDGYPFLLGGGDCNDRDPTINPGAQEWPDDGIDQNCDGRDATAAAVRSPALHPVPDAVPRDLNLLLITIDALRADHLGCYGYGRPTSPEIDRLAKEAIVFDNGWAHAPSTRYSMPAIATGRWPSAISWRDCFDCERIWWPRIGEEDRTIGQALKATGYFTGAFYSFEYFKQAFHRGFERGIDDYRDARADLHTELNGPVESKGSSSRQIADDMVGFIEAHGQDKWFLWAHFYDPHLDYQKHPDAPDFGRAPADLYDGEIWFTDHHLGRVLARLEELGQWDRTAIMITGDHGEGLGEHGIVAHGYHLYPPQTKVPFIIRVPGLSPKHDPTPVSHVDIAPTFLNLARGSHERSFLGRSMLDLLAGAPSTSVPPKPVFQEVTYELGNCMDCTRRRALVTSTHQLIWNWMPDNTTECYDLRIDGAETRDLWGSAAGAPCLPLKSTLQDLVQVLSLPPDVAEKMAAGVSARGAPTAAPGHPLEVRFGAAVRFLGYDLGATTVARGGAADIVYHYEVQDRVPAGFRPFFHLEGPGGFFNLDHVAVQGVYPVERWRPGQQIRDRQRIAFPRALPPGVYTLYTGFFHGSERLPVTPAAAGDPAHRLRVVSFVVQ